MDMHGTDMYSMLMILYQFQYPAYNNLSEKTTPAVTQIGFNSVRVKKSGTRYKPMPLSAAWYGLILKYFMLE